MEPKQLDETYYAVFFLINNFDCPPEEITSLLNVDPTGMGRKGDLIGKLGRTRRRGNFWEISAPRHLLLPEDKMTWILEKLESSAQEIGNLPTTWYHGFNIGIYYYGNSYPEFKLSCDQIKLISKLKTDLGFDLHVLYDVEENTEPRTEYKVELVAYAESEHSTLNSCEDYLEFLRKGSGIEYYHSPYLPTESSFAENIEALLSKKATPELNNCKKIINCNLTVIGGDNPLCYFKTSYFQEMARLETDLNVYFIVQS